MPSSPPDAAISAAVDAFIADALSGGDADAAAERQSEKDEGQHVKLPTRFEPPLVRLYCPGCRNHWDAWIDDDGELEDERDTLCSCRHDVDVTLCRGDCV